MKNAERDAIRWELAKRLAGMREPADHDHGSRWERGNAGQDDYRQVYLSCTEVGCPGYDLVPLTAEGLLDEGRLRRAIEAAGWELSYLRQVAGAMKWYLWRNRERKGGDPDLAVAYLKAVGAWPLKEDAHD